ncbi:MAG: NAD(P)-dependent oxidoreductase [Nanoarchaeota archaeon]
MKVAFFEVDEDWEKKLISEKIQGNEILIFEKPIQEVNPDELREVEAISVFIYSECVRENLEKLPNLKFLGTRSTGYNHIDLDYVREKNIAVTNVPRYGENTVAEFALGLLLDISRKICASVNRVKTGSFDFSGLRGFDLAHKTIGIMGFGSIGQKLAKMCKGLEMNVIAWDAFADKLGDRAAELGVTLVDQDSLFRQADVISLHLPLLEQTRHIINEDSVSKMKEGVILINTARGELVETQALLNGLNTFKISAVGADVIEEENDIKEELELLRSGDKSSANFKLLVANHALINHPNALITPHNAFNTQDALERIMNTDLYNLNCFLHGECCENRIGK